MKHKPKPNFQNTRSGLFLPAIKQQQRPQAAATSPGFDTIMWSINIGKSLVSQKILNRLAFSFSRSFYTSKPWENVLPKQTAVFIMNQMDPPLPCSGNGNRWFSSRVNGDRIVHNRLDEVKQGKHREGDRRKKAGLGTANIDAEGDKDHVGVGPNIDKVEEEYRKHVDPRLLNMRREEVDDSESEEEDHLTHEGTKKSLEIMDKKLKRHEELLHSFTKSKTIEDAFNLMKKIDKFEEKHLPFRLEYRVIGDLVNRLKDATGKEKFVLQLKVNRAIKFVKWKEAFDLNNPANYGILRKHPSKHDHADDFVAETDGYSKKDTLDEDDEEVFDNTKQTEKILLEKVDVIDQKLEEKLAELDHTFGRKGMVLEEEIRDLAEERNTLTEKMRKPVYINGFDVKAIEVNRTHRATKGGRKVRFTALLVCGNYHGVIGFAKAKGPSIASACQKAQVKCFQNLHYVERHEDHTIAHAIQASYEKTKVYLWPGPTKGGMKTGKPVRAILHLAGFKNVKSKIVGSRNADNTVKAVFKGLNAIETPKDVQQKFGRVVVDSYLLS
uniref:probable 37S ribosomal protein S5, mitochondrial n=1 Tax=Erigeron canadensis TaxID=72917 RepID=UPI001CB99469|nr:probable 37S ribosomal protein S5, mitochondrial [Erigeron canadensis]